MHGEVIIPSLFKAQNFEGISYRETSFSTEGESSLFFRKMQRFRFDTASLSSSVKTILIN